ncbi:MAG: hypothetical protein AABX89_04910 [Candidatus Thermoplasmatota archaeon]
MKRLSVALAAFLLLAGCASTTTPTSGSTGPNGVTYDTTRLTPPDDPMPEGAGHDHADVAQHKFLWNYDFSERDPLLQNAANVAGLHALDVQSGYLFGAVYGSHTVSVDGGLVIWDIADPAHPVQTGRWTIPGSVGGDRSMEATPDGSYVVIATEPVDCAGHVNPGGAVAAYLLDTRDKSRPIVADVLTVAGRTLGDLQTGGSGVAPGELAEHSVAVHRIGTTDYAFIFGKIYEIARTEQSATLVYRSSISTGHDIYVRDTPWNTTWAISANGGSGMVIHDITDPAAPFELAVWNLPEDENQDHYFHTADVSFQPDGQILLVLTSEDFANTVVSPLWVIDGNVLRDVRDEPSEPIALDRIGTWRNPGEHVAYTGLTFSLHNPRFHDGGLLTVSSYHGGLWQLDLRAPEFWANPAPIAYAAYADGTPTAVEDPIEDLVSTQLCGLTINLDAPSYWDVEVGPNGVLYLADGFMGLYTFTPTADHPVYGKGGDFFGTAGL